MNTRPIEDALHAELEQVKRERDVATEVVANIQGKVAMYTGKYEMEKKACEKAEKEVLVASNKVEKWRERAEKAEAAGRILAEISAYKTCLSNVDPQITCPQTTCTDCWLEWATQEAARRAQKD